LLPTQFNKNQSGTRPDFWLWVLEFGSKTRIGNFLFLKNWTKNQTKLVFEFGIHLCVELELEQNKTRTGELTRVYSPASSRLSYPESGLIFKTTNQNQISIFLLKNWSWKMGFPGTKLELGISKP
jgi:hypothetical protein